MKVLVCGGRDYGSVVGERGKVFAVLNELHYTKPITMLIHGGARGADTVAGHWAESRRVACLTVWADWSLGRIAGTLRNAKMLTWEPDLVVAFPGGNGTAHMVRIAREGGFEVIEVDKT